MKSTAQTSSDPNRDKPMLVEVAPETFAAKSTEHMTNILTAGQEMYLPISGDSFYFPVLSSRILVAVDGFANSMQPFNPYFSGTGLDLDRVNRFKGLNLKNPSATNGLVFEIFAGYDRYIDNRLTWPNAQFRQVSIMTYSSGVAAGAQPAVLDLSGTIITDADAVQWYAVNRQLICIFNNDSNQAVFLVSTDKAKPQGFAQPGTSFQYPAGGDFKVIQGFPYAATSVNATVTEIYNCLPKL